MFEGWGEFFLMVGSAAAVLIGLIFVVVTLMNDKPRSTVLTGSEFYMGPIVLNMSLVLVLSAAALVPHIAPREYAVIAAICAIWGLWRAVHSWIGINKLSQSGSIEVHWTDRWYYGAVPMAIFLALAAVATGIWLDAWWGRAGVAATITAQLVIGIRNEWDLVTWLAPKDDSSSGSGAS
jgi:hypothetical protein